MKKNKRIWYISAIAAVYLGLCSISTVRYAAINFGVGDGTVPAAIQLLCLGMAIAAGVYFVRPRVGHRGLILFTIGTLIAIGTTDPKATSFHLFVLCLLILPCICDRVWMSGNSKPCA